MSKGDTVMIVSKCYSEVVGMVTTILDEAHNGYEPIYCLDIRHPEDSNTNLWVAESEIALVVE